MLKTTVIISLAVIIACKALTGWWSPITYLLLGPRAEIEQEQPSINPSSLPSESTKPQESTLGSSVPSGATIGEEKVDEGYYYWLTFYERNGKLALENFSRFQRSPGIRPIYGRFLRDHFEVWGDSRDITVYKTDDSWYIPVIWHEVRGRDPKQAALSEERR